MAAGETEHLRDGWEPDCPADDTLLRRALLNLVTRSQHMATAMDGRFERDDVVSLADLQSPSLFANLALLLRPVPPKELEEVVARATQFFADRPARGPFLFVSVWPTPDMRPLGLSAVGHPPFMFRPPGGSLPPTPGGLRVDEVRPGDDDALHAFEQTLVEGYPFPELQPFRPGRIFTPSMLGPSLRLFLGWEGAGDTPVAVAGVWISQGVGQVEWVATRAEARGKGYGEAVTWHATLADPSLPAVLLASDPGRPIYERMGYVPLVRFTLWTGEAGGA